MLCGEHGESVGAMVWLHPDHAHRCPDGVPDDGLRADLEATLERLAAEGGGASQRIERLLVLTEPAGLDTGEITDKGYVNQRAVRERRTEHVAALTLEPAPAEVVLRVRPGHG